MLARTRRLDGRVEREQIRLLGDARDRLDDRADLLRALAELVDRIARAVDDLLDALDVHDGVLDALAAVDGARVGRARVLRHGIRRAAETVQGVERLGDAVLGLCDVLLLLRRGLRRVRHRLRDLIGGLRALVRARRELLRRGSELLHRLVRLLHERAYGPLHLDEAAHHIAELVAARDGRTRIAEVAFLHLLAGRVDRGERLRDLLRRVDARRDEDHEHDEHDDDDIADDRTDLLVRFRLEVDGALMLILREREEVLAHLGRLLRAGLGVEIDRVIVFPIERELRHLIERRMDVLPLALDILHERVALIVVNVDRVVASDRVVDLLRARLIFLVQLLQARGIIAARRHDDDHALRVAHTAHRRARVVDALDARLVHRVEIAAHLIQSEIARNAHTEQPNHRDDAEDCHLEYDLQIVHPAHKNTLLLPHSYNTQPKGQAPG